MSSGNPHEDREPLRIDHERPSVPLDRQHHLDELAGEHHQKAGHERTGEGNTKPEGREELLVGLGLRRDQHEKASDHSDDRDDSAEGDRKGCDQAKENEAVDE